MRHLHSWEKKTNHGKPICHFVGEKKGDKSARCNKNLQKIARKSQTRRRDFYRIKPSRNGEEHAQRERVLLRGEIMRLTRGGKDEASTCRKNGRFVEKRRRARCEAGGVFGRGGRECRLSDEHGVQSPGQCCRRDLTRKSEERSKKKSFVNLGGKGQRRTTQGDGKPHHPVQ